MNDKSKQNARLALKQVKMEIAAEYEMNNDNIFDMIEYAHNNGIDLQKLNSSLIRPKSKNHIPSHLE